MSDFAVANKIIFITKAGPLHFCYHVTILKVILVFVLRLYLMISGDAREHLHTLNLN